MVELICIVEWLSYYCIVYAKGYKGYNIKVIVYAKGYNSSLPWRDPDGKLTDQSWSCIAVRIFWCSL